MKKPSHRFQTFLLISLVLIISLTLSGRSAFAGWFGVQGNIGHLHNSSLQDVITEPTLYYAWGMGYQQVPFATNWIVFPIPAYAGMAVRRIAVNLGTVLGGDLVVDRVAVWNGNQKLVPDIVVDWSGDPGWYWVDLGSYMPFATLSISLRTWTGEFGGRVNIYSLVTDIVGGSSSSLAEGN